MRPSNPSEATSDAESLRAFSGKWKSSQPQEEEPDRTDEGGGQTAERPTPVPGQQGSPSADSEEAVALHVGPTTPEPEGQGQATREPRLPPETTVSGEHGEVPDGEEARRKAEEVAYRQSAFAEADKPLEALTPELGALAEAAGRGSSPAWKG